MSTLSRFLTFIHSWSGVYIVHWDNFYPPTTSETIFSTFPTLKAFFLFLNPERCVFKDFFPFPLLYFLPSGPFFPLPLIYTTDIYLFTKSFTLYLPLIDFYIQLVYGVINVLIQGCGSGSVWFEGRIRIRVIFWRPDPDPIFFLTVRSGSTIPGSLTLVGAFNHWKSRRQDRWYGYQL